MHILDRCLYEKDTYILVKLSRYILQNINFKQYFDNNYISLKLIAYLAKQRIHYLATIRQNRILSKKMPMKKI